jgi:NAD(P) transhydrogenase subunit beta
MTLPSYTTTIINAIYFIAAILFIWGLKRMSSPRTARNGIVWAGAGMAAAIIATFFLPGIHNLGWMLGAIIVGVGLSWWVGRRVPMTAMPQMVALFNGMGGGAAAAIGAVELIRLNMALAAATLVPNTYPIQPEAWAKAAAVPTLSPVEQVLAYIGVLIGAVSLTGSLIAFAKLQGWMDKRFVFPLQRWVNLVIFAAAVVCGVLALIAGLEGHAFAWGLLVAFLGLTLVFGIAMTLPIGGADMPVVISMYNAFTGLAVAFEGFVLQNEAMIIAGMVVGAAGTLLTQLMAKAMNRSLGNVLFGNFGAGGAGTQQQEIAGALKPIDAADAAVMMAYAERVAIVPGYGMAVAQAQHKVWEFARLLIERGVKVTFAIHPVAGRMPGHMNVLLAEAGVPYDLIADMDDINPQFPNIDVALVIGANDVVNPSARTDKGSPIYGMPILDVAKAKNVIVIKRGRGKGFAGIENALFYADNTRMLYGDGQAMAGELVAGLKTLDA